MSRMFMDKIQQKALASQEKKQQANIVNVFQKQTPNNIDKM